MDNRIDPNQPNAAGKTLKDYLPMAMQRLGIGKNGGMADGRNGALTDGILRRIAPQNDMVFQDDMGGAPKIDKKAIDQAICYSASS